MLTNETTVALYIVVALAAFVISLHLLKKIRWTSKATRVFAALGIAFIAVFPVSLTMIALQAVPLTVSICAVYISSMCSFAFFIAWIVNLSPLRNQVS